MKAGELNIIVTAQVGAFEAQMAQVERQAAQGGMNAGSMFANQWSMSSEKIAMNLVKQFASPMIVAQLADFVADGLEKGFSSADLINRVKNTPFFGSFFRLGEQLGEAIGRGLGHTTQAEDDAFVRIIEQQSREYQTAEEKKAAEDKEREAKALADRLAEEKRLAASIREIKVRESIASAKARAAVENGEDRELRRAQIMAASEIYAQQIEDSEELAKAKTADERNRIQAIQDLNRQTAVEERRYKFEQLREELNRRTENAKKIAESEAQIVRSQTRERVAEFEKQMKDIDEQIGSIEENRVSIQRETASVSTALGSFRISAYTDEQKKKNDETLVKEVQQLRRSMENVGASGGFR